MLLGTAACDAPGDVSVPAEGPRVLWTDPADGDEGVARRGPFLVGVDRRLMPGSASRTTVRLHSGDVQGFVSVRFDPVDRVVVAAPFFEQPLAPDVTWRLVVEGLRDLDDRSMDGTYVAAFRTGDAEGPRYEPTTAPWDRVQPIFERSCVGAACHGPAEPALGLDLSSPEGVAATAIGVPSRQLPRGTAGPEGARGAIRLAALPIVDVVAGGGRPATSYLLYKVLGDPHALGDPMPPPGGEHPPLEIEDARTISDWILGGATTSAE